MRYKMKRKFSQAFKVQAVEKALNRAEGKTILSVSESLGIGHSTLGKWLIKAKNNELVVTSINDINKEKRPHDLSLKERFDLVLKCSSLDGSEVSTLCREQGLYPHHIKQWELDFVNAKNNQGGVAKASETKELKKTIKKLERELHRKDKALAETAALLVLQKKVHDIWGENEDN